MKIMLHNLNNLISWLVLLLVFLLPLDLKFTVGFISGHGERVSQSAKLVHGTLMMSSHQALHLKLTDIVSLLICVLLFLSFFVDYSIIRKFKSKIYYYIVAFIIFMGFTLLYHFHCYTHAQFSVCLVYLCKFAQVSLFYLFVLYFLRSGYSVFLLFKAFIIGGSLAAIIGLVGVYTGWFAGVFIFDRVESYGMLIMALFVCFFWMESSNFKIKLANWQNWLLCFFAIVIGVAIFVCGKRTVMLGAVVGLIFFLVRLINKRNFFKYLVIMFIIFGFSWFSIHHQLIRTLDNLTTSVVEKHVSAHNLKKVLSHMSANTRVVKIVPVRKWVPIKPKPAVVAPVVHKQVKPTKPEEVAPVVHKQVKPTKPEEVAPVVHKQVKPKPEVVAPVVHKPGKAVVINNSKRSSQGHFVTIGYKIKVVVKKRVGVGQGLSPLLSKRLRNSWVADLPLQGLGYGVESRIARWFISTDCFWQHPLIGIGFWGVQYVYHFLPDTTYFQVLVEGGIIGFILFMLIIVISIYYSFKCIWREHDKKSIYFIFGTVWQSMTIALLIMSLSANAFYIFNLVGLYWIFTALMEYMTKEKVV